MKIFGNIIYWKKKFLNSNHQNEIIFRRKFRSCKDIASEIKILLFNWVKYGARMGAT